MNADDRHEWLSRRSDAGTSTDSWRGPAQGWRADSSASDGARRCSTTRASTFISLAFQRAEAFLFGRRTYEIFAGSWGAGMDPGNPSESPGCHT